ncbi:hypothetical protein ACHHYP_13793 [Achlya hypogyna]|uniref:TFIIS central domain-containing protein n=1 Tax=Achlya hypogyna TaxID=1202772 RepID=A0A1V9YEP5_ACHHY|nr:hypothetical protein ACHHYP_13793 [Achlya hypogyna]
MEKPSKLIVCEDMGGSTIATEVLRPNGDDTSFDDADDDLWAEELEKELALDVYVKKRSVHPFNLPHEVLMVLLGMVSVGRVCRAWSIAASEVARNKYRENLEELFVGFLTDDAPGAVVLARMLEAELHALHGFTHGCFLSKAYKETARRLKFNLRDPKNEQLRARLFSGELTPATLVRLRAVDMANPQLVEQRKEWIRKRTHEVTRDMRELDGFVLSYDLFNCPSCGSNETQHSEGRRKAMADRVCIIVICCKCPYRWQV